MRRLLALMVMASTMPAAEKPLADRVAQHGYPAVFQAWNPVDMPSYPQERLDDRLKAAAKHSLLWEEPISQLGYGVKLVLGAVWEHEYQGLATRFTAASRQQALANRAAMLKLNPAMVFLFEVRWRDAPGSFLPEKSPFWKRNPDGTRKKGWDGGPEPYYLLDADNPEFQANVARQTRAAIDSGVYDGIMLDWSGHLEVIRKVREVIGDKGLIIVNIHDNIKDGIKYKDYINGAFMENNPAGEGNVLKRNLGTWASLREALLYYEQNFRAPRVNCLEVWGDRKDLRRMRAATTLALTHSNGYLLYADPNPLKTPDHLHDWYPLWDVSLGQPSGSAKARPDGSYQREFARGVVLYNPDGNAAVTIEFKSPRRRASDGTTGTSFTVQGRDGDIFTPLD